MSVEEAIYFAFQAKKSAEMAAGVGQSTDICVYRKNSEAVFYREEEQLIRDLNRIYKNHKDKQTRLHDEEVLPKLRELNLGGAK